jgi:hypothetical protein
MLSTTVEPECPRRPFIMSYAMTGPGSYSAAHTVGSRTTIGAAAGGAPARESTKVLAHNTIHPAADRVEVYGAAARAIWPVVN